MTVLQMCPWLDDSAWLIYTVPPQVTVSLKDVLTENTDKISNICFKWSLLWNSVLLEHMAVKRTKQSKTNKKQQQKKQKEKKKGEQQKKCLSHLLESWEIGSRAVPHNYDKYPLLLMSLSRKSCLPWLSVYFKSYALHQSFAYIHCLCTSVWSQ